MDKRMESQKRANHYKRQMVGKKYRHFKGNIYEVIEVAVHSETAECRVIYRSDNDHSLVWDRELYMFLSEVDKEKYPDVEQRYRFEEIKEGK